MIEEELFKIWQSSPEVERLKFQKSRLIIDVQNNLDRIHKFVRRSHLRDYVASILGILIFGYYVFTIPFILTKVASGLIILWFIVRTIHLFQSRRNKSEDISESYFEYLKRTKKYLQSQKKLATTLNSKYVLIALVLCAMFLFGFRTEGSGNQTDLIIAGLITGTVVLGVHLISKKVIDQAFDPRIAKVSELIEVLDE